MHEEGSLIHSLVKSFRKWVYLVLPFLLTFIARTWILLQLSAHQNSVCSGIHNNGSIGAKKAQSAKSNHKYPVGLAFSMIITAVEDFILHFIALFFYGFLPFYVINQLDITCFQTLENNKKYKNDKQLQRLVHSIPTWRICCQCLGSYIDGTCDPNAGADAYPMPTARALVHLISF